MSSRQRQTLSKTWRGLIGRRSDNTQTQSSNRYGKLTAEDVVKSLENSRCTTELVPVLESLRSALTFVSAITQVLQALQCAFTGLFNQIR